MKVSIYHRHRFHSDIIRRAVWMYFRFNLSFRDVEELMAERGVEVQSLQSPTPFNLQRDTPKLPRNSSCRMECCDVSNYGLGSPHNSESF